MWTLSKNKDWSHLESKFDWVKRMQDVPQDSIHHAEGNVSVHTQMVLQSLINDKDYQSLSLLEQEILWAAALMHDIEKFSTTVIESNGRITSHGHSRKGAQTARQILYKNIETPFEIREQIWGLIKHHALPLWLLEKPDPLKTLIKASFEVNTKLLTILARADMNGRICEDQNDLLYRVECFKEYCIENNCYGVQRHFDSPQGKINYLFSDSTWPDYQPFQKNESFEVILMSGMPGAGKDTYIKKFLSHLSIISLDKLREEQDVDHGDKTGNGRIIQEAKETAKKYLRQNIPFVWNATNITSQMRKQLIDLFLTYKANVKIIYLEVPCQTLHNQNKNREAIVPESAMMKLLYKLEVPKINEAHEVVYIINQ